MLKRKRAGKFEGKTQSCVFYAILCFTFRISRMQQKGLILIYSLEKSFVGEIFQCR